MTDRGDSSSDVEDYMSEDFITVEYDVRPGVATGYSQRRALKIESRRLENEERLRKIPSRSDMEKEMRSSALSKPINEESKGFKLLSKMGYKPGMSLGKKRGNEEGIKEPLPLEVKTSRTGLGHDAEETQKRKQRMELYARAVAAQAKANQQLIGEFRDRKRCAAYRKQLLKDLQKSREACQDLDLRFGLCLPTSPYFWPIYSKEIDDVEARPSKLLRTDVEKVKYEYKYSNGKQSPEEMDLAEMSDSDILQRLTDITAYLRQKHMFCMWCGSQFVSSEELLSECPGATREDHE